MAKNRRPARRANKAAKAHAAPRTAAQVGQALRGFIARVAKQLDNRVNKNAFGWTPAEIGATFGTQATALPTLIAALKALGTAPVATAPTGTSGQ